MVLVSYFNPTIMQKSPDSNSPYQNIVLRTVFFGLGVLFLSLGIIGIVVPGLPTTVFVLLAGYCWAKSSRRFYAWLLNHRLFGPMIVNWQTRRAVPRFAKYLAWLMMTLSVIVLYVQLPDAWRWLVWPLAAMSLAVGVWLARLPDA
ncbi:hypothetical protein B0189_09265 [Moraxella cuniculi]|nr:hypothetical protein B0189_09265 [Moraxella cuniculi]